jgi:hypothetical protein
MELVYLLESPSQPPSADVAVSPSIIGISGCPPINSNIDYFHHYSKISFDQRLTFRNKFFIGGEKIL